MKKNITLLKLGGAVITNKEIPESVREDVLARLVTEIARAWKEKEGYLILGNGAGSFAHVPASRYKTMDGFIHEESRIGMAITQDAAARLNRIVVHELINQGVPAVSLAPSNTILTDHRKAKTWFSDVLLSYLESGLLPVVYGDVLSDVSQGCTIWSTDTVFAFLARELPAHNIDVHAIVHVTEAGGVWVNSEQTPENRLQEREIYTTITPSMKEQVKASMTDTKGFDVTGGMWHKISEALELVNLGVNTQIVSGLRPNVVYNTLRGDTTIGTRITK